jgi:hypothetical protein
MKAVDSSKPPLTRLLHELRDLQQHVVQQYQPVVDEILRTGCRDAAHIEHTLDGLLDFCDHPPMLALYKALCRHYWAIDAAAAVYYIELYRSIWDGDAPGEPGGYHAAAAVHDELQRRLDARRCQLAAQGGGHNPDDHRGPGEF